MPLLFDLFRIDTFFVYDRVEVKSLSIQINDLFEFAGQPVPAQRPESAVIKAMVPRQFTFLCRPVQIEISQNGATVSYSEESANTQDDAGRMSERASVIVHRADKADMSALERERDELAYALYGLTQEEIKIGKAASK